MAHYSIRAKVRKRRKAQLATNSRKYTVNNCTIKRAERLNLETITVSKSKEDLKKMMSTGSGWTLHDIIYSAIHSISTYTYNKDITPNGNGKSGFKKMDSWYKDLRKERKEYLAKNFPPKRITTLNGHTKTIKSKRPWYMLQKGENIHVEPKKHGSAWYLEALAQHKLARWEKSNPRPIPIDNKQKDLFEEQYIPQWEAAREKALERIRDFVVSVYDKLNVVGNKVDHKSGKMVGNVVAKIKDIDQKGHNVLYPNLKRSDPLYKEALNVAEKAMEKDSKIVDCDLQNHKKNQKRPLYKAA